MDKSLLLNAPKECQKRSFKSDLEIFFFLTAPSKGKPQVSLSLLYSKLAKITQTALEI